MIYPKKNFIIQTVFHLYVRFTVARHFNRVIFNDIEIDQHKSILLIANHSSFWDGLLLYLVRSKLFKKKFYVMLLEQTSKRIPILKYVGAFSINKKSKDIIESLNYTSQLLKDPSNLVVIFPQGKLYSNFTTNIEFEKGIIKVMKQATGSFQLVFATIFIEHFENKKPGAYIYLKSVKQDSFDNITDLQQAYQQHYTYAHQQQTQIIK
ncbi:1-acyl-sn-glycerol-3-phosphate acyltransferase [Mucilaginibacter sp. UR6-11]|uniref:1-acyl-sn-glycerol-3-phosphate acyltransferase n=1 Tax=Mucilaginibacter sp. UR6-11 TaxID=1435644 RepID=UPI001E3FB421|nr:1-acyl-sn-glycerol-3-phosphate acyltransferase [Mucilaginibacter sp. UR6-11]MCC8425433.1 1-acyl-sn-glycerol-3-phosphate acyltransferase [Mucilaginibacter sp. UR6-11]